MARGERILINQDLKRRSKSLSEYFVRELVLLVAALVVCGCFLTDLANPPVHYVLPDNYQGVFKILLDEKAGTAAKINGRTHVYEIPADGILTVNDFKPLQQMHEETAAYRNGKSIPISNSTLPDGEFALRSAGQHTVGDRPVTIIFVLGTKRQVDMVMRDLDNPALHELPPTVYNQQLLKP